MLKAGLLGLGTIGRTHKGNYDRIAEENGPVKVEAYFDMSEEAFSETGDARTYTDIDELLEKEKGRLDYIDICLPTFMHKDVAVKAMKMGYHVLCEKPMALNFEDAKEMCDVSKETGKTLMVAHPLRFSDFYKMAHDCIRSGELGKVRNARFNEYRSGLPQGNGGWFRNDRLSGGPILDVQVHDVDLIKWFFGTPKTVSALGSKVYTETAYDAISASMVFEDGMYMNIHADYAVKENKYEGGRNHRIHFENGYIFFNRDAAVKVDNQGNVEDFTGKNKDLYYNEIMYFADCVIKNIPVDRCPPEDSAEAIRIIEAEFKSADNGGKLVTMY